MPSKAFLKSKYTKGERINDRKQNYIVCCPGPWHGLPVSTPYMTKDHLEMKRSKAQAANTTYVYDFPELFKINIAATWKEKSRPGDQIPAQSDMVTVVEYDLDANDRLVPVKRSGVYKVGSIP